MAQKTTVRMGVIGTGHLGRIHAKLIGSVEGAKLVAVSDPSPEASARVADEYGAKAFQDHQSLIEDVDAVVVASPTPTHASIVGDLLDAGKHVLCEKPLTLDPADARRLAMKAGTKGLTLQVGHVERFNPAFAAAEPVLREVKYVEAVRASRFPGRCLDAGVVMDLMIHDLDLIRSLTDAPVSMIRASGLSVVSDHEDIAEARIEFECGLVASVKASRISPSPARQMQVFGSRGFADIDFSGPTVSLVCASDDLRNREFSLRESAANPMSYSDTLFEEKLCVQQPKIESRNAILDELHDFVLSIETGASPTVDGHAGADAVSLADQVLEAVRCRDWNGDGLNLGPMATPHPAIDQGRKVA